MEGFQDGIMVDRALPINRGISLYSTITLFSVNRQRYPAVNEAYSQVALLRIRLIVSLSCLKMRMKSLLAQHKIH